jgi:DNA-binding SARP family transcriptional activator
MELRVLGTVEAVTGDRRVSFHGAKPRTIVATLALANGETVPDTRLAAMLWGTHPPATASAQLYTYMSRLRKHLGTDVRIVRRPPGYALELDTATLDLTEFTALLAAGQELLAAGAHDAAADRLGTALARWPGTALGGVTEFLTDAEGPRLADTRLVALEARVEAELALGRHHRLVPELTALVADHPLRERLRAQLMTALYRANRQSDALSLYDSGRQLLADELGIAPGALLANVFRSILRGADPSPTSGRTSVSQVDSPPTMLPPDASDFTGRRAPLSTLVKAADRWVITGMAGVGKTTLAVRAAHAVAADFPDGQLFVDLRGAESRPRDPAEVLGWFLRMLGTDDLPATVDERAQLYRSKLAGQRVLIVLDNAGSGAQLAPLLPTSTTCRVIATARRHPAMLTGARTLELDLPSTAESLTLLTAIIGAERVAAQPDAARQLVDLCGRLPLAVRVAGARLAAWPGRPISYLVKRMTAAPSTMDELTFAELDVRASLATSCHPLSDQHHTALRRLAGFTSSTFPLWGAARALRTSPTQAEPVLDALVEARLLQLTSPDGNGQPRFRMHPLIRALARECPVDLGESPHPTNSYLRGP